MPIEITNIKPLKIPSCQNCENLAPIGNMRTNYTMQVKEERTGFFICIYLLFLFLYRFVSPEEEIFKGPNTHSVLYNAMIHPFLNMTIYGAIWYQGEANAAAPFTYNCTFPAMIDDWRSKWLYGTDKLTDPEFPFGFVQVGHWGVVVCYGRSDWGRCKKIWAGKTARGGVADFGPHSTIWTPETAMRVVDSLLSLSSSSSSSGSLSSSSYSQSTFDEQPSRFLAFQRYFSGNSTFSHFLAGLPRYLLGDDFQNGTWL